jgi:hypothetical protein
LNIASMSSCEAWPMSPSSLGPLSSLASPSRVSTIGGACALMASTPPQMFHHLVDVLLDELHRGHHLGDTLAGEVLEVAGLEDRDDAFLDFSERIFCWSGEVTLASALAA